MGKIKILLLLLIITVAGGGYFGYHWLHDWGFRPRALTAPVEFTIDRGSSLKRTAAVLYEKGAIDSPILFELWVRLFSKAEAIQAGRYRFEQGITVASLAASMVSGDVYRPIALQMTIPEGFTQEKIFARMAELNLGTVEELREVSRNRALLNAWKVPGTSLEGYLYPATYTFYTPPTGLDLLKAAVDKFWQELPEMYEQRLGSVQLTLHQGVTFASLIEKETKLQSEMRMVSEVIWNRLRKGMVLAIDASIIYGIPNFDGNLRKSHLVDFDNRYNTRIHPGLPPGPIGSPSREALNAVLTPTNHGYLYYVVDADDLDRHRFSKTHVEHVVNVQAYVRRIRGGSKPADPEAIEPPSS